MKPTHHLPDLNTTFKAYLDTASAQMIADLESIQRDTLLSYEHGKSRADVAAFYFEYEYDYLDIICWATDKKEEIITETQVLPTQKNSKANEKSNWHSFMPQTIWDQVAEFQDNYEEDDLDDILDDYNQVKYEHFEKWFCHCWHEATKKTGIQTAAYFSIHDTIFKTDLHTGKEITTDEISARHQ